MHWEKTSEAGVLRGTITKSQRVLVEATSHSSRLGVTIPDAVDALTGRGWLRLYAGFVLRFSEMLCFVRYPKRQYVARIVSQYVTAHLFMQHKTVLCISSPLCCFQLTLGGLTKLRFM